MNLLQIELDNDPSIINQENFIASKHKLKEKHDAHGPIFRTKSTWTEDGGHNSKFILDQETKLLQ